MVLHQNLPESLLGVRCLIAFVLWSRLELCRPPFGHSPSKVCVRWALNRDGLLGFEPRSVRCCTIRRAGIYPSSWTSPPR